MPHPAHTFQTIFKPTDRIQQARNPRHPLHIDKQAADFNARHTHNDLKLIFPQAFARHIP